MTVRAKMRPPLALLVAALVSLVFVMPTLAMAFVVAVSRSPGELIASLQENWLKIALALFVVASVTALTAYVFWRGLSRPLRALADRADEVAHGTQSFETDGSYGTREVAQLAESFSVVVARLQKRTGYLETLSAHLAHELKSPLTSIRGAAELLHDEASDMEPEQRLHFLQNIIADTEHLSVFTSRLRDLARADLASGDGQVKLAEVAASLSEAFPGLDVNVEASAASNMPLSRENADIVLHHIADNALRHGATAITLRAHSDGSVDVINNGEPIHEEVASNLFTPFFTTRRHEGGTGLGLAIATALLEAVNGRIELYSLEPVTFRISFPD